MNTLVRIDYKTTGGGTVLSGSTVMLFRHMDMACPGNPLNCPIPGLGTAGSEIHRSGLAGGIDPQHEIAIASVLVDLAMPFKSNQGLHNLEALQGHPGEASPWLVIVAATQTLQRSTAPPFIFSGGSYPEAGLWNRVLTPVPPLSK